MTYTGLLLGAVLGFVMQRGRFCVTGAFRDVWLTRRTRWLVAFLIAIAVQSVGFFALTTTGVLTAPTSSLPWLAVTVGSLIFGFSIVLAGGCATGTYYRSGEGLVGSWIALVGYAGFSAVMKYGALKGVNDTVRSAKVPVTTLHASLGISPWILVALFVAGVGYLAVRELRREPKLASLPARYRGLRHLLTERRWHPFVTGAIVGLLAIAAYPLSFAAGRKSGLGITTPSADVTAFLVTGDATKLDWGAWLVIGILVGSFIAAKASGEFRVRVPDAQTTVRSVFGGIGMGIGASWAGGCTIGNSMVQTAQFSYQGWVAFAFTLLGVGIATKLFVQTHGLASSRVSAPALVTA